VLAFSRLFTDHKTLPYTADSTASRYARVYLVGSASSNRYCLAATQECPAD
jgi:hypothetical protein